MQSYRIARDTALALRGQAATSESRGRRRTYGEEWRRTPHPRAASPAACRRPPRARASPRTMASTETFF